MASQRGFSLVELLVGMVLMALLASAAYKLINNSSLTEQQNRAQNAQADQLRSAMAAMRADLRDASAITAVTTSSGMDGAASGVTFRRSETSAAGTKSCVTERLQLVSSRVEAIIARKTPCDPDLSTDYPDLAAGTTRIMLDQVTGLCEASCPGGQIPLLRFYEDAVTVSDTLNGAGQANPLATWGESLRLLEVNLRRDGDGSSGLMRVSSLKSTVYLANLADRSSGSTDSFCQVP